MRRLALVQLVALVLAAGPVLGAPTALVVEILRPAGGEPYLTVSVQKRIGSFQIPCGRAGVVLAGPQGLSLTTVADLSGNARFRLNLWAYNRNLLVGCGVPESQILLSERCTIHQDDTFHSHRRDRERSGRMLAVIGFV